MILERPNISFWMCETQLSSKFAHCQTQGVSDCLRRSLINSDIPFTELMNDPISSLSEIPRNKPVYVICRFGNDSQIAVNTIQEMENGFCHVRDIKGGLDAWAETFPTDIIPKY